MIEFCFGTIMLIVVVVIPIGTFIIKNEIEFLNKKIDSWVKIIETFSEKYNKLVDALNELGNLSGYKMEKKESCVKYWKKKGGGK